MASEEVAKVGSPTKSRKPQIDTDWKRPVDIFLSLFHNLFVSSLLFLDFPSPWFEQEITLVKWRITLTTVLSGSGQCGLVSGLRSFLLSELTRDTQL